MRTFRPQRPPHSSSAAASTPSGSSQPQPQQQQQPQQQVIPPVVGAGGVGGVDADPNGDHEPERPITATSDSDFITPEDRYDQLSDDNDSLYSSGSEGSTASVLSSVFDYKYENGRRYHAYKEGAYSMPNDEREQDRLDMTHHMYLLMTGGKLYTAPLPSPDSPNAPQRILDLGTGTGIWAINIAEEFPAAEVIATDLSPIQPRWVPPNLQFEVDDAEDRWTWSKNTFGYIHIRGLLGAVKNWPALLQQAYDHLAPGGYIEVVEHSYSLTSDDNTYPSDCAIRRWFDLLNLAGEKFGRAFNDVDALKSLVINAGFEGVEETKLKCPWGAWAKDKKRKEIGYWVLMITESGFESYGMALMTRALGMSPAEVSKLNTEAFAELKTKKFHIYNTHHFIVGQKPLNPDQ